VPHKTKAFSKAAANIKRRNPNLSAFEIQGRLVKRALRNAPFRQRVREDLPARPALKKAKPIPYPRGKPKQLSAEERAKLAKFRKNFSLRKIARPKSKPVSTAKREGGGYKKAPTRSGDPWPRRSWSRPKKKAPSSRGGLRRR
jgi:hypothetical protein